jgi:PPOX class probable F420-dependent enzyme
MSELSMSKQQRDDFLAALHVGVLAVEHPDGPPLATPVWYRYEPGGAVEITTESTSDKARLLERAGRATVCVQREEPPYAYVTVDGPVEIEAVDIATRTDIATRYLGAEIGKAFIDSGAASDDIVVRLHPARWRTSDYSKLDNPGG